MPIKCDHLPCNLCEFVKVGDVVVIFTKQKVVVIGQVECISCDCDQITIGPTPEFFLFAANCTATPPTLASQNSGNEELAVFICCQDIDVLAKGNPFAGMTTEQMKGAIKNGCGSILFTKP